MAATRQCLGIDIGTHTVRIAEVAYGAQGTSIKKLVEARLEIEPGQKEAQRQAAIVAQITKLIKENKLKSRHAVFCVPGQTVFVRRVKVPATSPEKLKKIIRFEAREQIPFPLEKTILEYQVFETEAANEVEVLMVAIKREYIENFMKLVRKSGLKPVAISVSSLALHNFHQANCGAVKVAADESKPKKEKKKKGAKTKSSLPFGLGRFAKKKKVAEEPPEPEDEKAGTEPYDSMELQEIQAEVNLGATIMDLAIPQGEGASLIGFTRSVPVAGSQIDRAIGSKLGLSSMDEARRIKETETVILASDFEISGDTESVNMEASEAATKIVDRIIAELRRSLDFFISQPDGVAVDGLVLSGGLAQMPFLSNYLEERMGLQVELASVRNESFQVADDAADSIASFVIPIGLGLQGLGAAQINIDFLPQDIKNLRALRDKRGQLITASAFLLGSVIASYGLGQRYTDQNAQLASAYEMQRSRMDKDSQRIADAEKRNHELFLKLTELGRANTPNRYRIIEVYSVILQNHPPDVLFEKLVMTDTGKIEITGLTPRQTSIKNFKGNVDAWYDQYRNHLQNANLDYIAPDPVEDPRFDTKVFPFVMTMSTNVRKGRFRSVSNSRATTVDAQGNIRGGDSASTTDAALEAMNLTFGR